MDPYTLKYMVNCNENNIIPIKKINGDEVKFYKRRILNETKNLLNKKTNIPDVKEAYENYLCSLIEHFKFIDKKELIEREYKDDIDKYIDIEDILNTDPNELLYVNDEPKQINMDNFVIRNNKKTNHQHLNIIPLVKNYDIKTDEFKNKGINKKKQKKVKNNIPSVKNNDIKADEFNITRSEK